MRLAGEAGLQPLVAAGYRSLGSVAGELYQLPLAERYLSDGVAYCEEHQLDADGRYMLAWLSLVQMYQGRWEAARDAASAVIRQSGTSAVTRIMALVALGRIAARRGEEGAARLLDDALSLAEQTNTLQRLAPVRAARAEAAWLAGDLDRVREEAGSVLDLALEHKHAWHTGELLYWLHRAGERVEMCDWTARSFALQIQESWTEAAAEWQRLGCPYEAAQALAETAEPENLRSALGEFERLGARPAAQLTSRRLREGGVRGIPRGPRPSTRSNPAQLTRREVEIVRLLAEGLQNTAIAQRLFLSPKTVGHHVSSVLAKLGVHTRTEAAREAERLGLL